MQSSRLGKRSMPREPMISQRPTRRLQPDGWLRHPPLRRNRRSADQHRSYPACRSYETPLLTPSFSRFVVAEEGLGPVKIYISSTYQDLVDHRGAVDRALRRMGHDVIGMEQYVAEGNRPLDRCLADVRLADLYVVIAGWRYGYVPLEQPSPGEF